LPQDRRAAQAYLSADQLGISMKAFALTLAALVLTTLPAAAHEGMLHDGCAPGQTFTTGDITVTGAFTRATLPSAQVGAGYMTIENRSTTADRLLGATTEATPTVELHSMTTEAGMMKMEQLAGGIEIPAGGNVTLAPGGLHIMFLGPKAPFKEGECLAVTLTFETAGTLDVQLAVGTVGADAAPEHTHN
jgi:periplasmic copper chaperone A